MLTNIIINTFQFKLQKLLLLIIIILLIYTVVNYEGLGGLVSINNANIAPSKNVLKRILLLLIGSKQF